MSGYESPDIYSSVDGGSDVEMLPSENRKTSKPIMEKRRRARINASLTELKSLLLEVMKKEGARHHKMEKADILEMTVRHLRQLQRAQFTAAVTSDPTAFNKYQSGFAECATEVSRYLASIETNDVELKSRLLNHLTSTLQRTSAQTVPVTVTSTMGPLTAHLAPTPIQATELPDQRSPINLSTKVTPVLPDINNNCSLSPNVISAVTSQPQTVVHPGTQQVVSGVQLIPSRLPSGEVAFVIPSNVLTASQMSNVVIPLYACPTQAQTLPQNTMARPILVSPPVPVSVPQTPIMILPSPTTSPSPNVVTPTCTMKRTSPDSSTGISTLNLTMATSDSPQRTYASPTLKDSTNKPMAAGAKKELVMVPEHEPIKIVDPHPGPIVDENMWRPW